MQLQAWAHQEDQNAAQRVQQINQLLDNLQQEVSQMEVKESEFVRQYGFDSGPQIESIRRSTLGAAFSKVLQAEAALVQAELEQEDLLPKDSKSPPFDLKALAHKQVDALWKLYEEARELAIKGWRHELAVKGLHLTGFFLGKNGSTMAFVVATTWPFYTALTETLESFLTGPVHVFCTMMQYFYFDRISRLGETLATGRNVLQAIDQESPQLRSTWDKIKALFSLRQRLTQSLQSVIFKNQKEPRLQQQALQKLIKDNPSLWSIAQKGPLWPDFVPLENAEELINLDRRREFQWVQDRFEYDINALFHPQISSNEKTLRIAELKSVFQMLSALLSEKAALLTEQGRLLPWTDLVPIHIQLGKLQRLLDTIETSLQMSFALENSVAEQNKQNLVQIYKSIWNLYLRINTVMEAPVNAENADLTEPERRERALLDLRKRVNASTADFSVNVQTTPNPPRQWMNKGVIQAPVRCSALLVTNP